MLGFLCSDLSEEEPLKIKPHTERLPNWPLGSLSKSCLPSYRGWNPLHRSQLPGRWCHHGMAGEDLWHSLQEPETKANEKWLDDYFKYPPDTVIPEGYNKVWMGPTRQTSSLLHWVPSETSTTLAIDLQEQLARPFGKPHTNPCERDLLGADCGWASPILGPSSVSGGRQEVGCFSNTSTIRVSSWPSHQQEHDLPNQSRANGTAWTLRKRKRNMHCTSQYELFMSFQILLPNTCCQTPESVCCHWSNSCCRFLICHLCFFFFSQATRVSTSFPSSFNIFKSYRARLARAQQI